MLNLKNKPLKAIIRVDNNEGNWEILKKKNKNQIFKCSQRISP